MRVASRMTAISRGLLVPRMVVEDRVEVADLGVRRGFLQVGDEGLFARGAAVPGVGSWWRAPEAAGSLEEALPSTSGRNGV